jgi:hypothetical protein
MQNVEFVNINTGGTYYYLCALKCQYTANFNDITLHYFSLSLYYVSTILIIWGRKLPVCLVELLISIVINIMIVFCNICNKNFSSCGFSQIETSTHQKEKISFNT